MYRECARSSTCLEDMVRLAEDCTWNEQSDRCHNYSRCQNSLSAFYSVHTDVPIKNAALRCRCPTNEPGCLTQLQMFRPRCAYKHRRQMPSCLQVYSMCKRDLKQCFAKLSLYQRSCDLDTRTKSCTSVPGKCHQRLRIIWGTVLTLNCTCNQLESDDLQLAMKGIRETCHQIKKLLTNPACLSKST